MFYYLDTNALYNVKKIPESILVNGFYSAFSLVELIAGADASTFMIRKAVLKNIMESVLKCEYSFPEQLLFESFDFFRQYTYTEERFDDLLSIVHEFTTSENHNEFVSKSILVRRKFDFYYFVDLDKLYTSNFINATQIGLNEIASVLKNKPSEASITLGGRKYDLSSRRAIASFLNEPHLNSSFTIMALAEAAKRFFLPKSDDNINTDEIIYASYNRSLDVFVECFSAYSATQTTQNSMPAKNDYQDLTHLYYLKDGSGIRIVSNDKLFQKFAFDYTIKIDDLTSATDMTI